MQTQNPRRIGLIGHGRIGRLVARAISSAMAGHSVLAAVLTRSPTQGATCDQYQNPAAFFSVPVDLYLECAGPEALAALGALAMERADVWSVSGVALADESLRARLQAIGERNGHRLRLVAGASGGLDAVQALAAASGIEVEVDIVAPERCNPFTASAREAALRLPHGVNLAVAVALAGAGLDRTRVQVTPDPDSSHHVIGVRARSALGRFESRLEPVSDPAQGLHIVAASLVAALQQADRVIWVG